MQSVLRSPLERDCPHRHSTTGGNSKAIFTSTKVQHDHLPPRRCVHILTACSYNHLIAHERARGSNPALCPKQVSPFGHKAFATIAIFSAAQNLHANEPLKWTGGRLARIGHQVYTPTIAPIICTLFEHP
ncbi:hypothetical protein J6590_004262 [Homalodisca vitripennis]|nr:hypothetical protein J6590_004262 [Homalodisca vitripennis]